MEKTEKRIDLALGRDRKGKTVVVSLPRGAAEPGTVIRLAAGGFLTAEEVVTVTPCGLAWSILTADRPVLTAQSALKTVWRREKNV